MDNMCRLMYEPLIQFCEPLYDFLPQLLPDYPLLVRCNREAKWDLIHQLGPACTPELMAASRAGDDCAFFQDASNRFTQFLGGRQAYDEIPLCDKPLYFEDKRLCNILMQGMILYKLEPLADKLKSIIHKLSTKSAGDQTQVLRLLMSDPLIVRDIISLMESPEAVQALFECLRLIIDSTLGCGAGVPQPVAPVTENALCSPGMFLKQQREQRKVTQQSVEQKNMDTISTMLDQIQVTGADCADMCTELKNMTQDDITTIMNGVKDLFDPLAAGANVGNILKSLGVIPQSGCSDHTSQN